MQICTPILQLSPVPKPDTEAKEIPEQTDMPRNLTSSVAGGREKGKGRGGRGERARGYRRGRRGRIQVFPMNIEQCCCWPVPLSSRQPSQLLAHGKRDVRINPESAMRSRSSTVIINGRKTTFSSGCSYKRNIAFKNIWNGIGNITLLTKQTDSVTVVAHSIINLSLCIRKYVLEWEIRIGRYV